MFKRILLFLATNVAVLFVLNLTLPLLLNLFGVRFEETGLNLAAITIMAGIIGFAGSFISLAMSKWIAKRMTGARVIESPRNSTEQWLIDTVRRQAKQAGIGMPEVAIYQAPEINAFATGMNRDNALVAVSTGLLESMNRDEAEAVLGHEVSHIANGDMVTLALIQGVVNTFVIVLSRVVGYVVDRVILKNERGYGIGYWTSVIVAELVLSILASMIVMWFSRWREFRADKGGARLAGRDKMIAALERLRRAYEPSTLPNQMAAFGISGRVNQGFRRFFLSHPPLEDRIAALQRDA